MLNLGGRGGNIVLGQQTGTNSIPYLDPGTDFGHRSELLQKVVAGIKDAELSLAANKMRSNYVRSYGVTEE
eukprot:5817710-Amphidinium_carterae.1